MHALSEHLIRSLIPDFPAGPESKPRIDLPPIVSCLLCLLLYFTSNIYKTSISRLRDSLWKLTWALYRKNDQARDPGHNCPPPLAPSIRFITPISRVCLLLSTSGYSSVPLCFDGFFWTILRRDPATNSPCLLQRPLLLPPPPPLRLRLQPTMSSQASRYQPQRS
jgi:hypothetical protein